MPPKQKEPTRQQLTRGLAFQDQTPSFLRAFQARISGRTGGGGGDEDGPAIANDDEYPDYDRSDDVSYADGGGGGGGVKLDEFGREIRMGSEEREMRAKQHERRQREKRMEEGEEDGDEAPLVVVLKEGKHLSAREVENERRKARGLPPLPDNKDVPTASASASKTDSGTQSTTKAEAKSSVQLGGRATGAKRKAPVGGRADEDDTQSGGRNDGGPVKKKAKKEDKTKKKPVKGLLSFGDEG